MNTISPIQDIIIPRARRILAQINEGLPEVGIFWIIENRLLQSSVPYKEGIQYDTFVNGPTDHYRFWEQARSWSPLTSKYEYEHFPRGRVVLDTKRTKFYVYSSKKVITNEVYRNLIIREFKLKPSLVVFKSDEHYEASANF